MRVCHLVHGKAQLAGNGHSLMSKALFKSCNAAVCRMTSSRRCVDKSALDIYEKKMQMNQ